MRGLRVFAFPLICGLIIVFSVFWLNLAQDDLPDSVSFYAAVVTFNDRTYDPVTDQTTFSYTVEPTQAFTPISMFQVGIPDTCDLVNDVVAYEPTTGVDFGTDPDSLVPGIRWTLDLLPTETRTYTVTFEGNVAVGNYHGTIRATSGVYGREMRGPICTRQDETKLKVEKYVALPGPDPMTATWNWQDADDDPGIEVEIGLPVYFRYVVTNTSGSTLNHMSLTDDEITLNGCNIPASLNNGQSYDCVSGPVSAQSSLNTNTATVFGQTTSLGYSDTDSANYTGVTGPLLLSPRGEITASPGSPTYSWYPVKGVSTYNLFLATTGASVRTIFNGSVSASQYCTETVCEVDLTDRSDGINYWLANDDYQVFLQAAGSAWKGPFEFTINAPGATAVTLLPVTGTDRSKPYYNWSLTGNAVRASWFNVYLAPSDNLTEPIGNMWYSRSEACGSDESTICSVRSLVDMANGNYTIYVRSWGPGGFSTGGLLNSGYAGPMPFQISGSAPQPPVGLEVSEDGETFIWQHSAGASWYDVWIGTPSPDYTTRYWEWSYFEDLGCNMTCTLSNDDIPSGRHIWYVRAWGTGGFSTGGDLDGWNQGPDLNG